ncbi:MFS transporter [Leptolyngbya sp. AN03gr2]|uniref:MFS transporter n=1 Tax=unclassified Leptolyngbya TaxID=2650499 RepID=UPI003D31D13B
MLESFKTLLISQVSVEPGIVAIEESFLFSIPQFLLALFAGLVMAFAFQFLFTNLAVAFAATPGAPKDDSDSFGEAVRSIETKLGLFALIGVSISLFIATFLAVKLSLVGGAVLGAIVGVVIWSTYFTLIVWFGSSAIGSLLGSFISSATSGLQGMMGAATSMIGANVARQQTVATAEEIASVVRQELTSGINPDAIRETLTSSIASLPLPKIDVDAVGKQFENILNSVDLSDVANSDLLKNLNRDTIVQLIGDRTDLSKDEVNQLVDRLQSTVKNIASGSSVSGQLTEFVKTATPDELKSGDLYDRLSALVDTNREKSQSSLTNMALEVGLGSLLAAVQGRVDLSDLDVEKVSGQLQKLVAQVSPQGKEAQPKASTPRRNVIKADVESFVLGALPWYFNRFSLPQEFREIVYDPQANPSEVRWQLEDMDSGYFTNLLTQRGDLSEGLIRESAQIMETVRSEVLEIVRKSEAAEQRESMQGQIETYLRSSDKSKLGDLKQEIQRLLDDPETDLETLQSYLNSLDQSSLQNLLQQRSDFSTEEVSEFANQISGVREQALQSIQTLRDQAQTRTTELRQRVEDYLRNTNREELNPDAIEREIRLLFDDPQAGLSALQSRLSQFDRDTLVQLLKQRNDLSEEQINQILNQIESIRSSILNAPRELVDRAKQQYEDTTQAIADYLRRTNLEELDPDAIQKELTTLLYDPKQGASALGRRLSQFDRETLVKLLSQRGDLTETQVNQAIDQVQTAISNIAKAPRRAASRLQKQALNFESSLENYLRSTNKEELNPEGIKRDLQLLLNNPSAGVSSLGDRLSKIDRESLIALLSQREDISEAEATQTVDQILSVRDRIAEQAQQLQQRLQSITANIQNQIRTYLDSLDRPELSYEGIKNDFTKLFNDPQAGAEALRARLGQVDRGTLVALISSNPNISEAQANRIIDQIESAREGVIGQAEYVQQETQRRLNQIKEQAQKQAIATQKMAAGAAWWLFGTAFTSLIASAIAGFLAA